MDSDFTVGQDFGFILIVINFFKHSFPKPSYFLPGDGKLWYQETETYIVFSANVFFHTSPGSSSLGAAVPEPSNSRLHQRLSGLS